MAEVHFRCLSDRRVLMERGAADVEDLAEAREFAARIVSSLITAPTLEDWRNWALYVTDELGDEIFVVPFAGALGKPN